MANTPSDLNTSEPWLGAIIGASLCLWLIPAEFGHIALPSGAFVIKMFAGDSVSPHLLIACVAAPLCLWVAAVLLVAVRRTSVHCAVHLFAIVIAVGSWYLQVTMDDSSSGLLSLDSLTMLLSAPLMMCVMVIVANLGLLITRLVVFRRSAQVTK